MPKLDPVFWYFWIGLLMVLLVMFARGGVLGLVDAACGATSHDAPALETIGLYKRFGALVVANEIDFRLEPGARHALIGPNGAGKTTFVNLVTGRLAPSPGRILLDGATLPAAAGRRGSARARPDLPDQHAVPRPDGAGECALAVGEREGVGGDMLRGRRFAPRVAGGRLRAARAPAARGRRAGRRSASCPTASSGWSRSPSRSACSPTVLLLDEPAAGVPAAESGIILDVIEQLPADIAVLIIEHDMDLVFRFARRITVLVQGTHPGRGHAGRDRRRSAGARGLSRRASACADCASRCTTCPPGYGETVVLDGISFALPEAARWPCSAATASARRRCWRR